MPVLAAEHPAPAKATRPNIILITLDTTRADRVGFLNSASALTPHLDALARQSVVFPRTYSQVPITTASHATILTGTYPQYHQVNDFGVPLAKQLPYLPETLHERGYRTAAFVASVVLDPRTGAPGFDRGFDTYQAGFRARRPGDDRYQTLEWRGAEVVARAQAWLKKRPAGPVFVWVHLYDAHAPYEPPEPFRTRYAAQPYDGEIAYDDACVGDLLKELRAQGLYENSIIAVMADHGEAFGEHGERHHGVFLYDETIHVPLLIKLPGSRLAGQRIEQRVGLVDVAPTVLQLAGVAAPAGMQGLALLPRAGKIEDGPAALAQRALYSETDYPQHAFGWSPLRATRSSKYFFVEAPKAELYDQAADPGAAHNLAESSKAVANTLRAQLDDFRQKTSSGSPSPQASLSPEQQQSLSALGYLVSQREQRGGARGTAPDPKDKIEVANQLHDALLEVEDARYREAVPKLEQVLSADPEVSGVAYLALGTSLAWLRQYDQALPALRKAIAMKSDTVMAHYALALSLSASGDWPASVPEFEAAVARAPDWADMHFSLAAAYAKVGRDAEARRELEKTLALQPNHFRANLILGRMLTMSGDAAGGAARLEQAVHEEPGSPDAHLFLADAYDALGRPADAQRERETAGRLHGAPR
jgi:arylsulfatase A-like enzyme/Tfp pilus assembly protein PilF